MAADGLVARSDTVRLAMIDLADTVREGLLALAVGAGLQVMHALMQESVTAACGPKGVHDPQRSAVRHGSKDGSVTRRPADPGAAAERAGGPGRRRSAILSDALGRVSGPMG